MERIAKIKNLLDEKKALDIMVYDLKDTDYFVDYVIIATTYIDKHSHAIINHLKKNLKPLYIEKGDDWSVIDLGDILIHLMSEEYRAKYQLDELMKEIKNSKDL